MNGASADVSLAWLLDGIAGASVSSADGFVVRVNDLTLSSREAHAGSLFLALPGRTAHGLQFAAEAVHRGARAVLWDPHEVPQGGSPPPSSDAVFAAPVPALSSLVGRIADRFFGWPSAHVRIVGITGTNGKTTCADLLAQCLERLKLGAAYMGTLGWGRPDALEPSEYTTPDAVNVHRRLSRLRAQGVSQVAMEVSSQALDQDRVNAVRFDTAVFTNLTRDHLDYHGSMEAYGDAKARLFAGPELKNIVLNVGDPFGRELARRNGGRVPLTAVWVGPGESGWLADRTLRADEVVLDLKGMSMTLRGSFGQRPLAAKLMGRFNVENVVVVIACLLALRVPLEAAAGALSGCTPPPGRMEVIEAAAAGRPIAVIDYAHTPDALAQALAALREHCRGELWCVFGCGGDRDAGKRPMMGAVADELADRIIVTDDNPRSEDPGSISRAIVGGIHVHPTQVIPDRGAAIAAALSQASSADIVLIAGKGHEDYQIYGDARRSFSDRNEARRCLGAAA